VPSTTNNEEEKEKEEGVTERLFKEKKDEAGLVLVHENERASGARRPAQSAKNRSGERKIKACPNKYAVATAP
jgi:hypothetical protein